MSNKRRVLVVEDDEALLLGLEENLKYEGYEVYTAKDGADALEQAAAHAPELILLDVMLPRMSGYEVCRTLRDKGCTMPIIMLTARQDEFDKLHGFEMGADDYVTKPFSIKEVLARVRAVLLRGQSRAPVDQAFVFGDNRLDMDARVLTRAGAEVTLTRTEFDLLAYFCRHEGKALSRDQLMNDVWGTEYYGTQRSLDSFVSNLRSKIELDVRSPKYIQTVHGVGYKFIGDE
ncbi:MAG: response regulator transcription factor [Kiritimatiellae bacterium]|nr:response regulator transcription factor [Kiritimatiellia bacterium]